MCLRSIAIDPTADKGGGLDFDASVGHIVSDTGRLGMARCAPAALNDRAITLTGTHKHGLPHWL